MNTSVIFIAVMSFFLGDMLIIFDRFLWLFIQYWGRVCWRSTAQVLTAYSIAIGSILLFLFALYEGIVNPALFEHDRLDFLLYFSLLCSVFAYLV